MAYFICSFQDEGYILLKIFNSPCISHEVFSNKYQISHEVFSSKYQINSGLNNRDTQLSGIIGRLQMV